MKKSGHFFFNSPLGYGFDDGINSAIQVCNLLDNEPEKLNILINKLPKTYQSPTMGPFCKDNEKYIVIDDLISKITKLKEDNFKICSQNIVDVLTVNGIRFTLDDGSWGLIRALISPHEPSSKVNLIPFTVSTSTIF